MKNSESNALIRLTKSEVEMVINSLQFTEEAAEHFDASTSFIYKIKNDFRKVLNSIIEGEKNIETRNQTKKENRNGPQTCKRCDD
tara:strand:- start:168 stop:422 length:255 start_codon:yes stop_codon:yes gene_type:complete